MCISWIRSEWSWTSQSPPSPNRKNRVFGSRYRESDRINPSRSDKSEQIRQVRMSSEFDASDKRSVLIFYLGSYRIMDKRLDRKSQLLKPTCFTSIEPWIWFRIGFLASLVSIRARIGWPNRELIEGERKFTYPLTSSFDSISIMEFLEFWHLHFWHLHCDVLPWSCPPMINPTLLHTYLTPLPICLKSCFTWSGNPI
jgi:hypothetical protein